MPITRPRPKEFEGMNDDQLREIYQREKQARMGGAQVAEQVQPQQGQGIGEMIQALSKAQETTLSQDIGDMLMRFGGQKPPERKGVDTGDLVNLMKIQQMQNPGQAPEGYVNVGGEFKEDKKFIDPVEQAGIDWKKSQIDKNTREQQDAFQAEQSKNELLKTEGLNKLQAIRNAKKGSNFFGPWGGELPSTLMGFPNPFVGTSYPGGSKISDRTDWEANFENLKAQEMIDTITKMKEASKTGATGFGQLTEKEGQIVMDASMKLRRNLNREDATKYLNQMEAIQMKALGMPLSPEQQQIIDQINMGTYPGGGGDELSSIDAELAQINAQLGQ